MKNRFLPYSLGLLVLVGALACGDDGGTLPPEPQRPGAPSSVSATPGDAQANVSWTAPGDDGGSAIQEYVVRALQGSTEVKAVRSPVPTATVTGLTNGAAYSFTVAAVNAVGEGPASTASSSVVPRVIPGAPRNVSVTTGDNQLTVTWEAPEDLGMPITGYTVTVREGGAVVAMQNASGLSATLTGTIINGRTYQVTVTAANAVVAGASSSPVTATPRVVPRAPRVTLLSAADRGALYRWEAPDDGGSPVTGYVVTVREGDTVVLTHNTAQREYRIPGLENGKDYTATVQAINAIGTGAPSVTGTFFPCGEPAKPNFLFARSAGDGAIRFTWEAPEDTGGCPLTGYDLYLQYADPTPHWYPAATDTSFVVTGMENGVTTHFVLVARNRHFPGGGATVSGYSAGKPDAPVQFAAQPEDGAVLLTWLPGNTRGSVIFYYRVTVAPGDRPATRVLSDQLSLRVGGLTNGTAYTFTLVAESSEGDSDPVTVEATPQAP